MSVDKWNTCLALTQTVIHDTYEQDVQVPVVEEDSTVVNVKSILRGVVTTVDNGTSNG